VVELEKWVGRLLRHFERGAAPDHPLSSRPGPMT
jgi:hypothetical protein